MVFRVGERVVYPNHGVGIIENISLRQFGSLPERFYLLRLASNNLTIMVPFSHVADVGLRKVTGNGEVDRVLAFLSNGKCNGASDWKDRFKENSEKMRRGGMQEIAEVLKGLLQLQSQKPLSFRERKMLDRARKMLVTEVSMARSLPVDQAIQLIEKALSKSSLQLPQAM